MRGDAVRQAFTRACRKADMPGFRFHDLRRTGATGMAELSVAPHVIERILAHSTGVISGVAAVYNRASYLAEMREALEKWGDYLTNAAT